MKGVLMTPEEKKYVVGMDFGVGESQTVYIKHPNDFTQSKMTVGEDRDRKVWGRNLLIDLHAARPGPDQKKYQKVQLELRKRGVL